MVIELPIALGKALLQKRVTILYLREAGMSQEKVAKLFAVTRQTIAKWEGNNESIATDSNTFIITDTRIKVPRTEYKRIYERATARETKTQVAADYKITPQRVGQIVKKIEQGVKEHGKPVLPEGVFNVIYADPPWQYEFSASTSRSIEDHYPTLTIEEIKHYKDSNGIPIQDKIAENAILFLWTTQPKIREALQVIEAWGFDYKTGAVWIKDYTNKKKFGMGYYFREKHELLFVAKKGDIPVPKPEARPISIIDTPRGKHSKKPEVVYELIEKMYPNSKYLEAFVSKASKKRLGWETFGLEITSE